MFQKLSYEGKRIAWNGLQWQRLQNQKTLVAGPQFGANICWLALNQDKRKCKISVWMNGIPMIAPLEICKNQIFFFLFKL